METNGERPLVVALDLLSAFRQPGCPLCRIRQQAADRHLFSLLWESIGNMNVRLRLTESLGFCPEHTWQLYHLAAAEFAGETGAPILYTDIVQAILNRLRDLETRIPNYPPGRRRQKELPLTPKQPCPVCVDVEAAQERNMHWLVAGCADTTFRTRYAGSDGLCLLHLRQAVEAAAQIDPEAARFLVRLSILKQEALAADLKEYIRKRAWENRFEAIGENEQNALRRATRFVGGLEQDSETSARQERQARQMSIESLKQMGLRIDE